MKRAIALVATVLLSAACGGKTITAEEARSAVPGASQAQVGVPDQQGQMLTATPTGSEATNSVTAEYAAETIALAAAVNGGVAFTLGVVELVVSLPPTSCSGDTCTWGPGSGPLEVNDWQLTVTKKDSDDFVWALAGRPKTDPSAGFTAIVSGEAFTTGVRHVGHGTLLVDMDAAAGPSIAHKTTDPKNLSVGKISATYDNTSGRNVSVQFLGAKDSAEPTQKVNAAYQFAATSSGGDLQVATRNLTTEAALTLHSRWTDTGAGRGDATYKLGSLNSERSQCWDGASTLFNLVYQLTSPADPSVVGSESACAFSPAQRPTITAP